MNHHITNMLICISYMNSVMEMAAVVEYWQCLPNHTVPHHNLFYNVQESWRQTGPKWKMWAVTAWQVRQCTGHCWTKPTCCTSICRISEESGIPISWVWLTLHNDSLYTLPYPKSAITFIILCKPCIIFQIVERTTITYELHLVCR